MNNKLAALIITIWVLMGFGLGFFLGAYYQTELVINVMIEDRKLFIDQFMQIVTMDKYLNNKNSGLKTKGNKSTKK